MQKIILLFLLLLNALHAEILGESWLKKDELKTIQFFVENTTKTLTFRWTLFKDSALITHFKYDGNPHQFVLYQNGPNAATIELSALNSTLNPNPHIVFYFLGFDLREKRAHFRYHLFRYNQKIEVL